MSGSNVSLSHNGSERTARQPPEVPPPVEVSPTRLRHGARRLFGRDAELQRLDEVWANPVGRAASLPSSQLAGPTKPTVVTIVAWGWVGKTSLVVEWMNRLAADGWRGAERLLANCRA